MSRHAHAQLAEEIVNAKFYGTHTRAVIASNCGNKGVVQIRSLEAMQLAESPHLSLKSGKCVGPLEICGRRSRGDTLLAVATVNSKSQGCIELVRSNTTSSSFSLNTVAAIQCEVAITSLSYHSDLERIAYATEYGDVVIYDLSSESTLRTIRREEADAAGITQVLFAKNGSVVTAGMSLGAQARVFDLSLRNPLVKEIRHHAPSSSSSSSSSSTSFVVEHDHDHDASFASHEYYTSLFLDQTDLFCGTNKGVLALFDVRSDTSTPVTPHVKAHSQAINSVLMHPHPNPACKFAVAASADGTVSVCDLKTGVVKQLFEDRAYSFSSLDLDEESKLILAATNGGGVVWGRVAQNEAD